MPHRAKSRREKQGRQDFRRPAHARGYDHDWHRLRNRHLEEHPICEDCADRGLIAAERLIVDHVEPIDQAPHRRLDPTNLRTLCRPCHKRKTDRDKGRGLFPRMPPPSPATPCS